MKNVIALFAAALCLLFSSCHRPVAYFQPMPRPVVARLPLEQSVNAVDVTSLGSMVQRSLSITDSLLAASPIVASQSKESGQVTTSLVEQRMQRIQSLLMASKTTELSDRQPEPKPKKKLRLGNQIRQSLGMKLRPELNWWQRISWKLKASVLVILVAVLFAILHITILAIIFGVVGAFLLISGLKKSFKVRRPWF